MLPWIKRRRGVRRGPFRSEKYRRWVALQPCLICRKPGTQCAHVTHNGMSSKGPDNLTVPLCPSCHDRFDGRQKLPNGEIGKGAFIRYYGINLEVAAQLYFKSWQHQAGK